MAQTFDFAHGMKKVGEALSAVISAQVTADAIQARKTLEEAQKSSHIS